MKKKLLLLLFVLVFSLGQARQKEFWKPIQPEFDKLTEQVCDYEEAMKSDSLAIDAVIRKMYDLAGKTRNRQLLARAKFWDADNRGPRNMKMASRLIDDALTIVDSVNYVYDYHRFLELKANLLLNYGRYSEAYYLLVRLEEYFNSIGDYPNKAQCDGNIGLIYLFMDDFSEALSYIKKANEWFDKSGNVNMSLLANQQIAYIYESTGRKADALALIKSILDNFPKEGSPDVKFYYLSSYFRLLDDPRQQRKVLDEAEVMAGISGDWQCLMSAKKNKAFWFYKNGQPDSARVLAEEIYRETADRSLKFGQKVDVCNLLSDLYAGSGEWRRAYEFKVRATAFQDSIHGSQVRSNILKGKTKLEILRHDYQLRELEMEKRQLSTVLLFGGVGGLLLLVLLGMVIYLLRRKVASERQIRELQKRELTNKIDDQAVQVDIKNRELTSSKLLSLSKNEKLSDLMLIVDDGVDDGKIDSQMAARLRKLMSDILTEENDWDKFKMHFEEVHPAFFTKLKEAHPGLTDNELRLCAYCKMNIGNKQVAQMLSVQPQTIIIARYRMRKKMGLPKEASLDDYIRSF